VTEEIRSAVHYSLMTKPPNYLDFLVVFDDHFRTTHDDYIQDWSELHRIAQEADLETRELPQAARWAGELYGHKYLTCQSRRLNQDMPPLPFTDGDLQGLGEFRITPLGREEADRVRRQWREADTDALLGLRFPDLDRLAANDMQRRAIEGPLRHLREALDQEQWDRAIGSAKDLAEAACKVTIALAGGETSSRDDLPALVRKALQGTTGDQSADDLAKRIVSITQQLAHVRNTTGTGHGRDEQPDVSRRTGRLAADSALAVAEYVLSVDFV
jgi:hypothetical protein